MTIVNMAKLRAIAPKNNRRQLLKELTKLGYVEIESSADRLAEEEWADVAHALEKHHDTSGADQRLGELAAARELLDKYAATKSGLFSARRQISEQEFQDESIVGEAYAAADAINDLGRRITACTGEEGRLAARKAALLPWVGTDVPFDVPSGKRYSIVFGVSPAADAPAQTLVDEAADAGHAALTLISSDREQNYYILVAYTGVYDEVMDRLKAKGFSVAGMKDVEGTAAENIRLLDSKLDELDSAKLGYIDGIQLLAEKKGAIEQAIDVLTIESRRDQVLSNLAATQGTLYLEGWTPAACEGEVTRVLESHGCAYQFAAPESGEEAPVLLKNNRFIAPFSMITELYSVPTYTSGLDPNPVMAPFYMIFFGLMLGDISYGIILSLVSWLILKKARPDEGSVMQRLMMVMFYCGISTAVWGALFGSFFGDAISAFTGSVLGIEGVALKPILFDPLKEPMPMFIMSLAFGFIQVIVGLCVNAYKLIKHGQMQDAIYDVGFWLILLFGVPICILHVQAGLAFMGVGALGILAFAGREHANPVRRLFGGLGSLYGATGYLSDVLSYSRLLALGLATAVISQVMNTMASMGGSSIIGAIVFFVVFAVGHAFNIAINILGTFVHTSRLQFIEFFGKFFDAGGRAFTPLYNKTKYVEIMKEAQ